MAAGLIKHPPPVLFALCALVAKVLKGSTAMLCAIDKSFLLEIAFVQESGAHELELAVTRQLVASMPSKAKAVSLAQALQRLDGLTESQMVKFSSLHQQRQLDVCKSVLQKMLKGIAPHKDLGDAKAGMLFDFYQLLENFARASKGNKGVELVGKPAVQVMISSLKATLSEHKRAPTLVEIDAIHCFDYLMTSEEVEQLKAWQQAALANVAKGAATAARVGDAATSSSAKASGAKASVLTFFG